MPGDHAVLSPSGASRWMKCTPSARLELKFPDAAGEAAEEGTLAHELGELLIRHKLNQITKQKYNVRLKDIQRNPLYNKSMFDYATDYAVFVIELFNERVTVAGSADIELEVRLDLTEYVPESFGTSDTAIIGGGVLNIVDLKYGKGVLVEAEGNTQMKIYALGALRKYGTYDIDLVRMTIYQPRMDNIATATISVKNLLDWAETTLRPAAALAFAGKGEFAPGDHCRFCRVKTCKARADKNLEIAQYDFRKADTLTPEEVADVLERYKELVNWANDVEEFALKQALGGKVWPGFKVVAGKSNRYITDETAVAAELVDFDGFKESELYVRKLITLTALEELVGKKYFGEAYAAYIGKPTGAPTLAPLSDKRLPFGLAQAMKDFEEPCIFDGMDISPASLIMSAGKRSEDFDDLS